MSKYVIVLTTTPSVNIARKIADCLIKQKLAACVNIVPRIESHYLWQGKQHQDRENLLLIKTTQSRFKSICARIKKLHPYQVPEIISLEIREGSPDYLAWIKSLTK